MMSFAENTTGTLWTGVMPGLLQMPGRVGKLLFSCEVYPSSDFFTAFNPSTPFAKWAAVEVATIGGLPDGTEILGVPEGLYAVFAYCGDGSDAADFYTYIFTRWLPTSGYLLDNRPHLAIMGDKYRKGDCKSEEEICIPVRSA